MQRHNLLIIRSRGNMTTSLLSEAMPVLAFQSLAELTTLMSPTTPPSTSPRSSTAVPLPSTAGWRWTTSSPTWTTSAWSTSHTALPLRLSRKPGTASIWRWRGRSTAPTGTAVISLRWSWSRGARGWASQLLEGLGTSTYPATMAFMSQRSGRPHPIYPFFISSPNFLDLQHFSPSPHVDMKLA